MSEQKPLKREVALELENMSLKLHIMRKNLTEAEKKFMDSVEAVFQAEGVSKEEWGLNIDQGVLVKKSS